MKTEEVESCDLAYVQSQTKFSAMKIGQLAKENKIIKLSRGKFLKSSVDKYVKECKERLQIQGAKWIPPGNYND